jgi:hypothetical protein
MSLVTRYRLFWAALMAALLGLAFSRHQIGNLGAALRSRLRASITFLIIRPNVQSQLV